MYQDVMIGDVLVPMVATASTVVWYKQIFKRDLLTLFNSTDESDFVGEMAYVMAMQGAKADMRACNFDTYVAWLDQFTTIDLFGERTQNEIIELFIKQQVTSVAEKKKVDRQNDK